MLLRYLLAFGVACVAACSSSSDLSAIGEAAPQLVAAPEKLNILVIGATRGVGLETVKLALARGHEVTATARRPERMSLSHPNLKTVKSDILDAESVQAVVAGQDAIVIAIGIPPTREPVQVFSQGTENVLAAMQQHTVTRLSVVTGIGAGDSRGHGGFFYDSILQPLMLETVYRDKDIAEAAVRASGLDWTIVRPGFLNDDSGAARYRVIQDMQGVTAGDIPRADVAHFLLASLESQLYLQSTVLISN